MMRIGSFGLISAFCAALNIAVLILSESAGLSLLAAVSLSFCACVVAGYTLHVRFTYRHAPGWESFLRYTGAMAMNFPLLFALLWLFRDVSGMPMAVSAPASTAIATVYNAISVRWALKRGKLIR